MSSIVVLDCAEQNVLPAVWETVDSCHCVQESKF